MKKIFCFIIFSILISETSKTFAQKGKVIDEIIAVVGKKKVLKSEFESNYMQVAQSMTAKNDSDSRCQIFEEMLYQKILSNQADVDSVVVNDNQVDGELDRRMRYFISQLGSQDKVEQYFKKTITEIRKEFRDVIKDQLLSQTMEQKITEGIKITPSEVRIFYNEIPKDSIPKIEEEYEICQIVKTPPVSKDEKEKIKAKLNAIRDRIQNGEDFATLAVLYSEDPGSSKKGGELGFHGRGELYSEFEAVAYSLKPGEVSTVLETKAGFHILQVISRRGEQINVRHILLQPKPSMEDMVKAKLSIDSVYDKLNRHEINFLDAVTKYSDDAGKVNNGSIINPMNNSSKFNNESLEELAKLNQILYSDVTNMKVGDITKPKSLKNDIDQQVFKIIYLKSKTDAHIANLRQDYDFIQNAALKQKQYNVIKEWIDTKKQSTYVRISDEFVNCKFKYNWK